VTITASNFEYVRTSLARRVAISLTEEKEYLVINRLLPLLRRHGIESLDAMVMRLRMAADDPLWDEIVDALTTNETSFFRDNAPFEILASTILPSILANAEASGRNVHIWSAGCSSGQEALSIAMLAMETAPQYVDRLKIIGSDVSATMLRRASAGRYMAMDVARGVSDARRRKFFREVDGQWEVIDSLKQMIRWEKFSLADTWPILPRFDVVFLRNVMVYFDQETRHSILTRVHSVMRPGGVVILGSAESMMIYDHAFEPVTSGGATYYVAT